MERQQEMGGATVWLEIGLGLGLGLGFLVFFSFKISPPLCVLWRPVFIGKNIAKFPNLIPQLLSFFVKLIFLIFLDFTYQHRLEWGKSVILKYIALKVEHVPKIFKNLNSFETMQIY